MLELMIRLGGEALFILSVVIIAICFECDYGRDSDVRGDFEP